MEQKHYPTAEAVQETAKVYAEAAVEFGARYSKTFDFTVESIKQVEQLADVLSEAIPEESPSEEKILEMARVLGSYVGEVYRRTQGGEWEYDIFMNAASIESPKGFAFWPIARCYNRLVEGKENNLWHYFLSMLRT